LASFFIFTPDHGELEKSKRREHGLQCRACECNFGMMPKLANDPGPGAASWKRDAGRPQSLCARQIFIYRALVLAR